MNSAVPDAFDEALAAIKLRKAWADSLAYAIAQCHPLDASQVMIAALEGMAGDSPPIRSFLALRQSDAEFWASLAEQAELQTYTLSGLQEMTRRAITLRTRRQIIAELWKGLPEADRRAFIAKASGDAA